MLRCVSKRDSEPEPEEVMGSRPVWLLERRMGARLKEEKLMATAAFVAAGAKSYGSGTTRFALPSPARAPRLPVPAAPRD